MRLPWPPLFFCALSVHVPMGAHCSQCGSVHSVIVTGIVCVIAIVIATATVVPHADLGASSAPSNEAH